MNKFINTKLESESELESDTELESRLEPGSEQQFMFQTDRWLLLGQLAC